MKKFRIKNPDRWPGISGGSREKKLHTWCQVQRQAFAGTLKNRKELSQDRVDKLNQIGFNWTMEQRLDKEWQENFERLCLFVLEHGALPIPARLKGKTNRLFKWVAKQQRLIKEKKLPAHKIKQLKEWGAV